VARRGEKSEAAEARRQALGAQVKFKWSFTKRKNENDRRIHGDRQARRAVVY